MKPGEYLYSCVIVLLVISTSSVEGQATTLIDCGTGATVDSHHVLSCDIAGTADNGISWFRGTERIAACIPGIGCQSTVPSKYLVSTANPIAQQNMVILNVDASDIGQEFSCIDQDNTLGNIADGSKCNLALPGHAATTIDCGTGATVGSPYVLSCDITGSTTNGISWFRGTERITACILGIGCQSTDPSKYLVSTTNPATQQNIVILNVDASDIGQEFSCIDQDNIPGNIADGSQCNLALPVGISCGTDWCIDDPAVVCNNGQCECAPGYIGNGKLKCTENTNHICWMQGAHHIKTFNGEMSSVQLPCNNIATHLDMHMPNAKFLFFRVTLIVDEAHQASHAFQYVITGVYVEVYLREDVTRTTLKCNSDGCTNNSNGQVITSFTSPDLNYTVTRDNKNGQTVLTVPFYNLEVRYRGDDGSVTIVVSPYAVFDASEPGLCNTFTDPPDINQQAANALGLSYNNLIFFQNEALIPTAVLEDDAQCMQVRNTCVPTTRETIAINSCARIYTEPILRECFYTNRNKTMVLDAYLGCREQRCNGLPPSISFCNAVSACGYQFLTGTGCPPPLPG